MLQGLNPSNRVRAESAANGVIGKKNCVEGLRSAVEGTITLHGDDSVSDDEVGTNCRTDVENALVNAGPVETFLASRSEILGRFRTCSSC